MKISSFKKASFRRAILPASIVAAMAMSGSASAFKIDMDNPDLDIRWDNTFRYNAGWRMQDPTYYQASAAGTGPSETKFKSGDMVTNRLDLLSEFDFIYNKDTGFRVSGAAWYDTVYDTKAPQSGLGPVIFPGGRYPAEVKRYYQTSGEFLDAFVFTKFNFGDVPVNVKLGQHTVYWGETLFSLANGVAAGQSYVDLRKALATPGVEAKEVFKPLNQFSFSAQLSPELTMMGQYFFDWKSDQFPLGGTYFSFFDPFVYQGDAHFLPPGLAPTLPTGFDWGGTTSKPKDKSGDWGLAAKWRPEWLDGTAGLYYREYTPKNGSAFTFDVSPTLTGGAAVASVNFDQSAPRTKLIGFSLAKQIWGVSFGADLTYRKNAMLAAAPFLSVAQPGLVATFAGLGATVAPINNYAPIGNVYTGVLNMIAYDGKRDLMGLNLYDSAVIITEFSYNALDKITRNGQWAGSRQNCGAGFQQGQGRPGSLYGCFTGESYDFTFSLEPKWFQVWSGVDITMPVFYTVGLKGNSVVPAVGSNEHQGAYSIGVAADVDAQYNFALKYNGFIYKHDASKIGVSNAVLGDFSHKGWLSLTAKATW